MPQTKPGALPTSSTSSLRVSFGQFEAPKAKGSNIFDNAAKELAAISDELEDDSGVSNNDNESGEIGDSNHKDDMMTV